MKIFITIGIIVIGIGVYWAVEGANLATLPEDECPVCKVCPSLNISGEIKSRIISEQLLPNIIVDNFDHDIVINSKSGDKITITTADITAKLPK